MTHDIAATTRLNNGVEMPWLGLGVFQVRDAAEVDRAIKSALDLGYRSIDTAAVYENERETGESIRTSGVSREDVFLTTKLWNRDIANGNAIAAFEASLDRLGTDYVDLYLVHWPIKDRFVDVWREMEEIYASGRARAIGVSNYMRHHLEPLLEIASIVPAVNQIEFHPQLVQPELRAYCREQGIQTEAWSPLIQGAIFDDQVIGGIAEKYGVNAAQVVLRWDLQHGVVTIPKSIHPERIASNASLFDFELSAQDMDVLNALDIGRRNGPDPDEFGSRDWN